MHLNGWLRDVGPSDDLRHGFGHDPAKWVEFKRRYHSEVDANPSAWQPILGAAMKGPVTLLFGARDQEHSQTVVLRDYLTRKLQLVTNIRMKPIKQSRITKFREVRSAERKRA